MDQRTLTVPTTTLNSSSEIDAQVCGTLGIGPAEEVLALQNYQDTLI